MVIGGGAAGMAAALEIRAQGFNVLIAEREDRLGGILLQCIHNGFGLIEFHEELTGPEYADIFIERVKSSNIEILLNTTVMAIKHGEGGIQVICLNGKDGHILFSCRAVVLAMGSRERNLGNLRIPGTRPAGVYTAGFAQCLINLDGFLPGKEALIIGSGDIGLIMARRMIWSGCKVHGVVEILPYPSGIARNIVQCLKDFDIPLYLSHVVTKIHGHHRVEGVDICPLEQGAPVHDKGFFIPCDTVLISAGLIPENELSREAGIPINPQTSGPIVDSTMMTNIPGFFAAGNVLHVHDIVDYVTEEARRTGKYVAAYLQNSRPQCQVCIIAGSNVRYVNPTQYNPEGFNRIYFRSMIVKNSAMIEIKVDGKIIKTIKKHHIQPSEMVSMDLHCGDIDPTIFKEDSVIEVNI